jgi:predicted HTH transcriptional regulator
MIPKPLNEISDVDLQALIANGVAEGRTIDYKRQMPGNSDGDKREFLADASSFANTGGGDLVNGIDETGGLPTQIAGVQAADLDLEIRRLDSILAAGLNPRIRYGIKTVTSGTGGSVVVLRVERS